jgi:hypothetical protein
MCFRSANQSITAYNIRLHEKHWAGNLESHGKTPNVENIYQQETGSSRLERSVA